MLIKAVLGGLSLQKTSYETTTVRECVPWKNVFPIRTHACKNLSNASRTGSCDERLDGHTSFVRRGGHRG